jgi:hypothetical protein
VVRLAVILQRDSPGMREERLGRILTFFGVPWISRSLADLAREATPTLGHREYAILGSSDTLAAALLMPASQSLLQQAAAVYGYGIEDRTPLLRILSTLTNRQWKSLPPSGDPVPVRVTEALPELTGPMSGIEFEGRPTAQKDAFVPSLLARDAASDHEGAAVDDFVTIVSVGGAPSFVQLRHLGVPVYLCASEAMVDLDEPVRRHYYDVKDDYLSAVPLTMFITSMFREVIWRPHETGACLIIDDPLLKTRYGFCDFLRWRDRMREHRFTTCIAFIPWNWRRTTRRASEFFRSESDWFSVSIHGCDHTAAEFGSSSVDLLDRRARLAQTRMRKHQARTGIRHDPVMVFPHGAFSSVCPEILKLNGFVASVNTEIAPVDADQPTTRIRDVWDLAILRYGSFAIYTRRYQHHGLENFAFDLLLGKPCFIVAHHESLRDGGASLLTLIDRLQALNCTLKWQSPGHIVSRAYRRRRVDGLEQVEMYANEIRIVNSEDRDLRVHIRKRETMPGAVTQCLANGVNVPWTRETDSVVCEGEIRPGTEWLFKLVYSTGAARHIDGDPLRYKLSVAARRMLSELRDELQPRLRFGYA